jgi:hypothetical protein
MGLCRRFLYLVLDECSVWRSPCCTLHRIEPSRLFFPDASEGRAATSAGLDVAADEDRPPAGPCEHGSLLYSLDDYSGESLTGCVL